MTLNITITPEQQAATRDRIEEAFAPLLNQMRTAAPLMAPAAAEVFEGLRSSGGVQHPPTTRP
ncbi:hypothetical protein OG596_26380 [Streptomyces sp. NBC_01102]|uniref:hypothetical protein n=1 Tax=Streptomyces sp. NBC_01102 TaxID=2903749 RepID=UPI003862E3E1|nr:hypothetical protein OG596_26380 [Streptomyces sp. NBC_01102]